MSLACSEADLLPKLEFRFLKSSLTSYSLTIQFLAFMSIWGFWKWSQMIPITQSIGFATKTMSRACSKAEFIPKLECHFLKSFLTSCSPCTQFLAFRSIWGFWKWSQMIPHTPKHWCSHQNHVSNMLRSWVTPEIRISLLEVLLDLLQSSPSTLFFTFRSILGSRKWSQTIPHTQKPGVGHQNKVSPMARSKITIIWLFQ